MMEKKLTLEGAIQGVCLSLFFFWVNLGTFSDHVVLLLPFLFPVRPDPVRGD